MPILKYMGWVGASLVVFLLYADWYLPRPVTERYGDTIDRPVIRITSLQPPPERIFIDTSVSTLVPPPRSFEDTVPSRTSPSVQSHASLGALAIIERETPPRTSKATSERPAPSILDVSESRGTLTEADRLDIPHLQHEAPAQRISSVKRMTSPNVAVIPASNEVVQQRRGAANKAADVEKSKPGSLDRKKKAAKTDRSKAAVEVKPCLPNVFGGILKALNISRGCET